MIERKFWWAVGFYSARCPQQRSGQAIFHTLRLVKPKMAKYLRGSKLDPFYKLDDELDDELDELCQWISDNWNNPVFN